jgi:adenosylcobinamide-GDP ribazoletransferase
LAAAGACSRAVAPLVAVALPYARPSAPTPAVADVWPWPAVATGAALGLAVPVLLLGGAGLAVAGGAATLALVLGLFFYRWLGGVTGDCLGAVVELAETLALIVVLALR